MHTYTHIRTRTRTNMNVHIICVGEVVWGYVGTYMSMDVRKFDCQNMHSTNDRPNGALQTKKYPTRQLFKTTYMFAMHE